MIRFILVQVRALRRRLISEHTAPHTPIEPGLTTLTPPGRRTGKARPASASGKLVLNAISLADPPSIELTVADHSVVHRYVPYEDDEKVRIRGEVHRMIAPRDQRYQSNFVEVSQPLRCSGSCPRWGVSSPLDRAVAEPGSLPGQFRNHKLVYRRYAGLFFSFCVDSNDNELVWLEAIHLFVEVLGTSLSSAFAPAATASRVRPPPSLNSAPAEADRSTTHPSVTDTDQFFGNVCELVCPLPPAPPLDPNRVASAPVPAVQLPASC